MKSTGFVELVILVAALVAGLPLFIACARMGYSGLNTVYMDDKSTWRFTDDVEWEMDDSGKLIPVSGGLEPMTITAAQMAVMPMVQDEYCPIHEDSPDADAAVVIDINYDANTLEDTNPENSITVKKLARASRYDYTVREKDLVPLSNVATMKNEKFYFLWNKERNTWMITKVCIDLYSN